MLKEINDGDWEEAFKYSKYDREEVTEIIKIEDGINDGLNWILLCKVSDGNFMFLSAGCDYTGWG